MFQVEKHIKIISISIFVLGFDNCFMHYTEKIPPNQIHDGKEISLFRRHLPIKLKLNRSNIPKSIPVEFVEKIKDDKTNEYKLPSLHKQFIDNYIENYYSEEILAKFKINELFINNPNANIMVEIKALPIKIEVDKSSRLYSAFSLGMIPYQTYTYGQITFELVDLDQKEKIKEYTYKLNHRQYVGTSLYIFSPLILLFSDYIDHSGTANTYSIMWRAHEAFHRDLTYDLSRDPKLLERFYIHESPNYSLQIKSTEKGKEFEPLFQSMMESALIAKGFHLFDIDRSYSGKKKIDRSILIEKFIFERNLDGKEEVSKIKYEATCQDLISGNILWKQSISYATMQKELLDQEIIQIATQELFRQLSQDGII
ncbi:hypothetical protein EHQ59_09570 [Leptospira kemamanensis]|uniref:Lipoprotein n=2 Tax=Leptospira kemamanensis TaxID=2484942 RepID=A0A4R9JQA6_9LEPT|nr:hypothetical protein EHQ59_09570 [Leptospira kemamanensis]